MWSKFDFWKDTDLNIQLHEIVSRGYKIKVNIEKKTSWVSQYDIIEIILKEIVFPPKWNWTAKIS